MPPRTQVHEPDDEDIIANPAVLASADLLPHILSSFELNEGLRVAPVCTAWADVWRSMLQEQHMPLRHVSTASTPCVHCCICELPNGNFIMAQCPNIYALREVTPDLKVLRTITHSNAVRFKILRKVACSATTLYVLNADSPIELINTSAIYSFSMPDFAPLASTTPGVVDFALSADHLLAAYDGHVRALDKDGLDEHSRIDVSIVDGHITTLAVLGEALFVSDCTNSPRACVHILSLQGKHIRTVNFDHCDVWRLDTLTAAHGRLYATEYADNEDFPDYRDPDASDEESNSDDLQTDEQGEDYLHAQRDMGKRLLVLSPQLKLLQVFRLGVPSKFDTAPEGSDFSAITTMGANQLLALDSDLRSGSFHVIAAGQVA